MIYVCSCGGGVCVCEGGVCTFVGESGMFVALIMFVTCFLQPFVSKCSSGLETLITLVVVGGGGGGREGGVCKRLSKYAGWYFRVTEINCPRHLHQAEGEEGKYFQPGLPSMPALACFTLCQSHDSEIWRVLTTTDVGAVA